MKIKVHSFYQDIKGNKVKAGEYDSADLKNGIAQYLVDNGHAVVIEEPKPKPKRTRRKKTS